MATVILSPSLAHFGTKGMKWGVRRNRATDVLSKADRDASKANMRAEGEHIVTRLLDRNYETRGGRAPGLGDRPYSSLSKEKRTIDAGKEFYRVTPRKDEKIRDMGFVSTNATDRNTYRAVIPDLRGRGGKKSYKQNYEHTFEATKKLSLPSEKDRIDAFAQLMDTKSISVSGPLGRKEISGRTYLKRAGYGRDVRKLDDVDLARKHFNEMTSTQHLNTPMASSYFKSLRDKGYDAVQDDNDKGVLSRDPLIVLNPNGSIKTMHIRQLSNAEVNKAQQQFKGALK